MNLTETHFNATPEKGEVSALLMRPEDATHLLVLGHGASTNMRRATLQKIANALAKQNIAAFVLDVKCALILFLRQSYFGLTPFFNE